jgi:hypothetical protein
MAEQAAVNREAVGSTPTGAAIYCRMDDWQVALTLNQGEVGTLREAASRLQAQLLHPNFNGK